MTLLYAIAALRSVGMVRSVNTEQVTGVLIAGEWYPVKEGSFHIAGVMQLNQPDEEEFVSLDGRGSFAFVSRDYGMITGPISSILAYRLGRTS